MSKKLTPLEALEKLYRELADGDTTNVEGFEYYKVNKYYHIVEKSLKALEIIKINASNITLLLLCESYEMYVELSGSHILKEEYDLVMEELSWKS